METIFSYDYEFKGYLKTEESHTDSPDKRRMTLTIDLIKHDDESFEWIVDGFSCELANKSILRLKTNILKYVHEEDIETALVMSHVKFYVETYLSTKEVIEQIRKDETIFNNRS